MATVYIINSDKLQNEAREIQATEFEVLQQTSKALKLENRFGVIWLPKKVLYKSDLKNGYYIQSWFRLKLTPLQRKIINSGSKILLLTSKPK